MRRAAGPRPATSCALFFATPHTTEASAHIYSCYRARPPRMAAARARWLSLLLLAVAACCAATPAQARPDAGLLLREAVLERLGVVGPERSLLQQTGAAATLAALNTAPAWRGRFDGVNNLTYFAPYICEPVEGCVGGGGLCARVRVSGRVRPAPRARADRSPPPPPALLATQTTTRAAATTRTSACSTRGAMPPTPRGSGRCK